LALAQDWIEGIHGIWFHLSGVQFDAIQYAEMAIFKIGTIIINALQQAARYLPGGIHHLNEASFVESDPK